ncbi:MAG TPA: hypothetical protein VGJ60_06495 [Chloroflexota bacterium]
MAHIDPRRFRYDAARRRITTVAGPLGHESPNTVRIKTQPDIAALERAAVALEKA